MNQAPDPRPALPERLFTYGSTSLFLALMGMVGWALSSNALLK